MVYFPQGSFGDRTLSTLFGTQTGTVDGRLQFCRGTTMVSQSLGSESGTFVKMV